AFLQHLLHARDLVLVRRPLARRLAHDVLPERAVADERGDVDADPSVDAVQIFAEALPLPADRMLEHVQRHRLDAHEAVENTVAILRARWRECEAAVAGYHRCDAVPARRGRDRIPEELRVEMRMEVDKPRRERKAVRVDDASAAVFNTADVGDPA